MKKLISSQGGLNTYLEVKPMDHKLYPDWKYLRLTTQFDGSKDPAEERVRFDWCLDPETFKTFKDFVNEV
jgi:hypothetical protein